MDHHPPESEGWKPERTAKVSGRGNRRARWCGSGKNGKSLKNDPISALSHLACGRSPAYIETGCRWPRSCRSVRTSNGSNRGSARVAWCFHSIFGCRPHVAWGVHRLVVPAAPPYSAQADRSGFGPSRSAAVGEIQTYDAIQAGSSQAPGPIPTLSPLLSPVRFITEPRSRPGPVILNRRVQSQPRFQ